MATQPVTSLHPAHPSVGDAPGYRRDLEGIRAVAIVAVVLYHADVPGFAGGFVGVDVFFVLSGYLITRLLALEIRTAGSIDYSRFFVRRIARLLPASAIVTAVILAGAALTYPPLRLVEFRAEAVTAAGYFANVYFAATGTDYFADSLSSPFAHYWSLALEEQFYLIWPLLIGGLVVLARRLRRSEDQYLALGIMVVVGVSLALSIVTSRLNGPFAFNLLPTRAWELAAGGLLAVMPSIAVRRDSSIRTASSMRVVGLSLIAGAVLTFDADTVFPGAAALVPVTGTLFVIASGSMTPDRPGVLTRPLAVWIGNRSYGLYLWHWPLLVWIGTDAPKSLRFSGIVASILVAAVSFHFIEQPMRDHIRQRSAAPVSVFAAAALVTGSLVGMAVLITEPVDLSTGIRADPLHPISSQMLPLSGNEIVPDNLRPSLMAARRDLPEIYSDGCHRGFNDESTEGCHYGDENSSTHVLLFGDSHAAQWFPAIHGIAERRGWRLTSMTKSSCPSVQVTAEHRGVEAGYPSCERWRDSVVAKIARERPDLVIVANSGQGSRFGLSASVWFEGLRSLLAELVPQATVVVLSSTPQSSQDIPVCLSGNLNTPSRCAPRFVDEMAIARQEQRTTKESGGFFVDATAWICPESDCLTTVGDTLVYRDSHHLTASFARLLEPALDESLQAAMPSPALRTSSPRSKSRSTPVGGER